MIEIQGLTKEYGDLVAVDDVTLTAQPGEVFGLLGQNGAGKSTTIGCLVTMVVVSLIAAWISAKRFRFQ